MASPLFLSFCNICKSNYKLLTLFLWKCCATRCQCPIERKISNRLADIIIFLYLCIITLLGWFYKLALLDFELIFEVKMQESEGV